MDSSDRQHRLAYVYAAVAVIFWATSASAFKLSLRYVGVLSLLFFASVTSTLVFLVGAAVTGKLKWLRRFSRRDYLCSAGLGLLNPFLYYAALFQAYALLPAQEAQPLNFVWPLTLVLLSIPLLGQRIGLGSIFAIIVSFCGVVVIGTRGDILGFRFSNPLGTALALSTTVVWSLFWIFNTKDKQDATLRMLVNFAFASVYILLLALCLGKLEVPPWRGLAGAAYIGLFEMGITFLAWLKALRTARTTAHVVNLIYLVPFLSLVVIALVVGERILPATVVGLVLIVTGIVLQRILERR
jgi:drug/metabolite transporter (DMT)-like permease